MEHPHLIHPKKAQELYRAIDDAGIDRGLSIPFIFKASTGFNLQGYTAMRGWKYRSVISTCRGDVIIYAIRKYIIDKLDFDPWGMNGNETVGGSGTGAD